MRVSDLRQRNLVSFRQEQPALDLGFQDTVLRSQIFVPHQQFLIDGAGDVGQHASPNHSRASLELIVEPGLYMLLRFQKAAGRGNYETGNQAFSKRLRFLTIRVRPLLPRGPDSSRTREGHSRWSSCSVTAFEWPQGYLLAATGWSASPLHNRGLTISSSEPNSFAVRIGGSITPGSWQSSLSRSLLGTRRAVEDHAMQSAAFQGGASCIKDSAAFSFDEPQSLIFLIKIQFRH